jgi:aminoglycoside phosphotransferase (APT) family kinase protein
LSEVGGSAPSDLAQRLGRLIGAALPSALGIAVESLTPMFGGNARRAWSFDLSYRMDDVKQHQVCVLLSQGGGRQIDTDIAEEYAILRSLNGRGARAPAAVAVDPAGAVIGAPSIVLERLPGAASAVDFLNNPDREAARRLTFDLAAQVARLHQVEPELPTADAAIEIPSARAAAAAQIAHWRQVFLERRMEPMPVLSHLFRWLTEHVPEPPRICLVHGDLRPGNFLYQGERVTGLLDWEMAHRGDPGEDLGWLYRPLWSPQRFVPLREFLQRYADLAGCRIPWRNVLYYRIFSELKFAAISITAAGARSAGRIPNLRHLDRMASVAPCLRRSLDWIDDYRREFPHD